MFPLCLHLDPDELIVYNYSPTQMHGLLCLFSAVKHGCVSDKHRICFLFLLLSPKRDFTTHCIVLTYLKITYTNRNKKTTQFIHFWSPHCVWVPHHHLESLLHILCERSESVSRHYLCIFPSFHIFHLKFQILFTKGSFCLLKQKKILFPVQTLFLRLCNELLAIWGLLLLGWLTSHRHLAVWHREQTFITHNALLTRCTGHGPR